MQKVTGITIVKSKIAGNIDSLLFSVDGGCTMEL